MAKDSAGYVHGTDHREQRRLSDLNDLVNQRSLAALDLKPGERVLDVGSGLGQLTRGMARATGVRAVGIERSAGQIAEAKRQAIEAEEADLVELREGDAMALPLRPEEWGTFDVAHTRFLLEHVPDPLGVVKQMVLALKPGGRLVLEDDDYEVFRMYPEAPRVRAVWDAYLGVYAHLGNDAIVGRKLVWLLHQAGAVPEKNDWLWFGGCAGEPVFVPLADNLDGILHGARESILKFGLLGEGELEAGLAELEDWKRRADGALWYAISWAQGRKP